MDTGQVGRTKEAAQMELHKIRGDDKRPDGRTCPAVLQTERP